MSPRSPSPRSESSPFEPRVIGESAYDRVTSLLMAVVLGAFLVFGWLSNIAATSLAYASRVARPVQIIEVAGGGGGRPEGRAGGVETVDVPGGAPADHHPEDLLQVRLGDGLDPVRHLAGAVGEQHGEQRRPRHPEGGERTEVATPIRPQEQHRDLHRELEGGEPVGERAEERTDREQDPAPPPASGVGVASFAHAVSCDKVPL